jgi:hypothetical protein
MREKFGTVFIFSILALVIVVILSCRGCILGSGFDKPPSTLKESDLVGTWQEKCPEERNATIILQ